MAPQTSPRCSPRGENAAEERVVGTFAYRAGLGSGVTVRTRYRTDDGASQDVVSTVLFGLRLTAFADRWGVHTTNTITHSVADTYQEFAGNGSYSLGNTGPFVVLGWPIHDTTEGNKQPYGRIQIGGADWPATDANRRAIRDSGSTMQIAPLLFGYAPNQAAGTLDIDLDIAEDADVSPTYNCTEQVAVAFSLVLAG